MQSESQPLVSTILPVYNGAEYLRQSIDSILNQEYQNFELIIIDDGSKDNSWEIISSYTNQKIKAHKQANQGLAATLNRAISLSEGEFIARQDQDDISLPSRFKKQIQYFKDHPSVDLLGTWAQVIQKDKLTHRFLKHPTTDKEIKTFILFDTPFVHTSVMFKKASVEKLGLYSTDPKKQPPEDYELWSRMALNCNLANIPEVLVEYREIKSSMSRTMGNSFTNNVINAGNHYASELLHGKKYSNNLSKLFHREFQFEQKPSFKSVVKEYKTLWEKIHQQRFNPLNKIAREHLFQLSKRYLQMKLQEIK